MTTPAAVGVYAGTLEQQAALAGICQVWQAAGFWPLPAVHEALSTYGTALTFVGQEHDPESWSAACLYRTTGQVADLLYIFVRPEFRRHGLAELLLDDMLQRLRKSGCERLLLEVRPGNTAAIRLYETLGMRRIAVRKRYYQNGDDALIFQLDLG